MTSNELETTARALVVPGKGILAADETVSTISRRLAARKIPSTTDTRRVYREMLFTTPGIAEFISGVIMHDETIRQSSASGASLADILARQDIIPGIKVDLGAHRLAGSTDETITEGLDGLRDRLQGYGTLGARFAKWRAVIAVSDTLPSPACLEANAHALARYAALCQEQGIVPIVEPEVLMDGSHTIVRCEEVTGRVLHAVFDALYEQGVSLEGMLLKPNMVISGKKCRRQAPADEIADATVRCLGRHVPAAVPGIVFLSGGQEYRAATVNLDAINRFEAPKPWRLSFSYGRALQDEAMEAWGGKEGNIKAGQQAFGHRSRCVSRAALGRYTTAMEGRTAASGKATASRGST